MKKIELQIIAIAVVALLCIFGIYGESFAGLEYLGFLSVHDGGLSGTGIWLTGDSSLSWIVSQNADSWHYKYVLEVPEKAISHLIIETSDSFTYDDLSNASGAFGSWFVDEFSEHNGNPGMPGTMKGIKFDETSGINLTVEFDSYHMPIWGDFYSKDGKSGGVFNAIWNAGCAAADPTVDAHDGSEAYHLLVPDTIPEPVTLLILGFGGVLMRFGKDK